MILRPVFYHGKLAAFMVNTGHHADRTRRGTTIDLTWKDGKVVSFKER